MQTGTFMKIFLALLFLAAAAGVSTARAVDIDGVKIDDKVVLASGVPELVLNGAGVRHKFAFLKVYIGSLYLTQKKTDSAAVFADPGPKRVSMHILSSEVTAQDLISSMNNALAANLSRFIALNGKIVVSAKNTMLREMISEATLPT